MKQDFNNTYSGADIPSSNNSIYNGGIPNQNSNTYNGMGMPNQNNNAYNRVNMPNQNNNAYNSYTIPKQYTPTPEQVKAYNKKNRKTVIVVVLALLIPVVVCVCFILAIFGIVFGALNSVKDSEKYDLAYSYLVNSEAFEEMNVDESEIKLTGYSTSTGYDFHTDVEAKTTFTFKVDHHSFDVICHKEDGEWYVCNKCTEFE